MNRLLLALVVWFSSIANAQTPAQIEAERRYNAGVRAMDAEKWLEAIRHFDEVLKVSPREIGALHGRGWALGRLQKWDASIRDYNRLIELNPKDSEAFFGRAMTRKGAGDYSGLVADMEEATRLDPENEVYLEAARSTRNWAWIKWGAVGLVGCVLLLGVWLFAQQMRDIRAVQRSST